MGSRGLESSGNLSAGSSVSLYFYSCPIVDWLRIGSVCDPLPINPPAHGAQASVNDGRVDGRSDLCLRLNRRNGLESS